MTRLLQDTRVKQAAQVSAMQTAMAELEHALRQPLNAGSLYLAVAKKLLARAELDDDEHLQAALTHAKAELRRIHRLLLDAREKCDVPNFANQRFDLKSLLAEFVDSRSASLAASAIKLELDATPAADSTCVSGQPELLCVVLDELLANAEAAMQGMPNDQPRRIRIRVLWHGTADAVLIEFSDTGPGVSLAVRASPFVAYEHARAEHLGLGLATCRRLLRRQQGDIRLEPGTGARFVISLQRDDG